MIFAIIVILFLVFYTHEHFRPRVERGDAAHDFHYDDDNFLRYPNDGPYDFKPWILIEESLKQPWIPLEYTSP